MEEYKNRQRHPMNDIEQASYVQCKGAFTRKKHPKCLHEQRG